MAGFAGPMDQYIFQWALNGDVIVTDLTGAEGSDYVVNSTEHLGFNADGNVVDTVNSGWFGIGFVGSIGNDHVTTFKVIYDRDSGVLYFDADGTGSKAGMAFASISKGLKLSYRDFDII